MELIDNVATAIDDGTTKIKNMTDEGMEIHENSFTKQ